MTNVKPFKQQIQVLATEFGFQQLTVADINTSAFFPEFKRSVDDGFHGTMRFLEENQSLRQDPSLLHSGTCRVLSVRYNYLPKNSGFTQVLKNKEKANISRYALGRDYHKLMRKKLKQLAIAIGVLSKQQNFYEGIDFDYRVLVDSAPVLETGFAEKSGLGWKGKHTLVINKTAGSWFFLGEIFINLPIDIDPPVENSCASCTACISICPTNAIVEPYKVDARRCISYLTIENKNAIPIEFRKPMGNRIYGCDDCQLICPWNRYGQLTKDPDFNPRSNLDCVTLLELFHWSEQQFLDRLQGSPIRRIGFQSWQRNIAVALGNAPPSPQIIAGLKEKRGNVSALVDEHINWALGQLDIKNASGLNNGLGNSDVKTRKLIRSIDKMLPRDA